MHIQRLSLWDDECWHLSHSAPSLHANCNSWRSHIFLYKCCSCNERDGQNLWWRADFKFKKNDAWQTFQSKIPIHFCSVLMYWHASQQLGWRFSDLVFFHECQVCLGRKASLWQRKYSSMDMSSLVNCDVHWFGGVTELYRFLARREKWEITLLRRKVTPSTPRR